MNFWSTWKELIVAIAVAIIVAALCLFLGFRHGVAVTTAADHVVYNARETEYQRQKNEAIKAALDAQKIENDRQIREQKALLEASKDAIADAQQKESQAKVQNSLLTQQMERLRRVDKDVESWYSHCLPAAIRDSVHAQCVEAGVSGSR